MFVRRNIFQLYQRNVRLLHIVVIYIALFIPEYIAALELSPWQTMQNNKRKVKEWITSENQIKQ
jgi:hypothetical protein